LYEEVDCGESKQQEQSVEPEACLEPFGIVKATQNNHVKCAHDYWLDDVKNNEEEAEAYWRQKNHKVVLVVVQQHLDDCWRYDYY